MERVTARRRGLRTLNVVALVGFATLFIGYGLSLEAVYAGDQAGDVFVQDANGNWVKQGTTRAQPRTAAPVVRHRAPVARAQSATEFARAHHMTARPAQGHLVLEDGASRIRLYPNSRTAVLMGKQVTLKQAVLRRNGDYVLPSCVATYFAKELAGVRHTQYQAHRAREHQLQLAAAARARTPVVRAPRRPLPVRIEPAKPAAPVVPKAAPKPAPVADTLPDTGWAARGVAERKWKWIILHHSDDTSGNAAKYDRVHRYDNGWEHGLGYHFVIGNGTESRDGQVEVGSRWAQQLHGAHAKTHDNCFNDHGIGVCLVGDFDTGTARPTKAQMDNLVRLVRWLQQRYGIANDAVRGHCDCCPTACPGKNFPWDELRRRIR